MNFYQGYPHIANDGATGVVTGARGDVSLMILNPLEYEMIRQNTSAGGWIDFRLIGSPDPDNCKVRYREASAARNGRPAYEVSEVGC